LDQREVAIGFVPEKQGLGLGELGQKLEGDLFRKLLVEMLECLEAEIEGVVEKEGRVEEACLVEYVVFVPSEGGDLHSVSVIIVDQVLFARAGALHSFIIK